MLENGQFRYRFGEFELSPAAHSLKKVGATIDLAPKEFKALLLLVEQGGMIVEKGTFSQEVWDGAFVGDGSLARTISVLRKHIGPDAIETVPRLGYRFALPVMQTWPADHPLATSNSARQLSNQPESKVSHLPGKRTIAGAVAAIGLLSLALGITSVWSLHHSARVRWARNQAVPEIERLVEAGQYVKAAALMQEARTILPADPTLGKLWMQATGEVSIASVPSGAEVSIRPYKGDPSAWTTLGMTPLKEFRVPRDEYVWRITKPGFAPVFFIDEPPGAPEPGFKWYLDRTLRLWPVGKVPLGMVVVSGGVVGLASPSQVAPFLDVGDFLIDRHEVTNEEYKKFVDAGGYQRSEFWKQPFRRKGKEIPWEEAVSKFRDGTGRPGPATWEAGSYRSGMEQHPVAGVSWYEAAAYAEFVGKSLPTVYHWTQASQNEDFTSLIASGSNFQGAGTREVGSSGALSGYGTTDMAGNVKEWCLNEGRNGRRYILGGGFGEPAYMFALTDEQSPWDRRPNFGFRCVKLDSAPSDHAAAHIDVNPRDFSKEKPVAANIFKAYAALYVYDKGALNPRIEETRTTASWTREKISFDAAYDRERVIAYLFLPRHGSPPFQTVVYFPGAFALFDENIEASGIESSDSLEFLLKSGRALLFPIYKGTYERRDGLVPGGKPPAFFRDHVIEWSKDLGRSLDYLETRQDIDSSKVAYFGASMGGVEGPIMAAVESRIRVMILSSGGFQFRHDLPEVDPLNFAPHVTIPVLMLTGRYDQTFPLESSQLPLFRILGTPSKNKKQVIYEGGHGVFPHPDAIREILNWLDKYLGPAQR
jgi:eukaryotic-like serine/threonine-protein kinase